MRVQRRRPPRHAGQGPRRLELRPAPGRGQLAIPPAGGHRQSPEALAGRILGHGHPAPAVHRDRPLRQRDVRSRDAEAPRAHEVAAVNCRPVEPGEKSQPAGRPGKSDERSGGQDRQEVAGHPAVPVRAHGAEGDLALAPWLAAIKAHKGCQQTNDETAEKPAGARALPIPRPKSRKGTKPNLSGNRPSNGRTMGVLLKATCVQVDFKFAGIAEAIA